MNTICRNIEIDLKSFLREDECHMLCSLSDMF